MINAPRLSVLQGASALAVSSLLLSPFAAVGAQVSHAAAKSAPSVTTVPQRSPREWAQLAANNEIAVLTHDQSWYRYQTHVTDQKGSRVREVIEAKEGTVARTIMENGKPLSADAEAEERKRLQTLAASPSDFAKHVKGDLSGKKLAADLIGLLPDAMIYTPAAGQENTRSPSGNRMIVLDFAPNPAWKPPTTTSEALTGIRGRMWIDPANGYVLRLQGEIFRSVNIGWGMLAHVYPGGKINFEQANIGGDRWLYTHFADQARVRALMLKTVDVSAEASTSNYRQLPGPISYQQAIELLLR